jgi:hypothetical protein
LRRLNELNEQMLEARDSAKLAELHAKLCQITDRMEKEMETLRNGKEGGAPA